MEVSILLPGNKVCMPSELGGLGIHNLVNLQWDLWMRWLWLQKNATWTPLEQLPIHANTSTLTQRYRTILRVPRKRKHVH